MAIQNAQKIQFDARNEGIVACEQCGISITINASACTNPRGSLVIKCPCGTISHTSFDKRRSIRKAAKLRGVYIKEADRKKTGEILVENLSPTGLRFRTVFQHDIAVNDTLQIKFALDDEHRTIICEQVRVRYVRRYQIGACFLNTDVYSAALGIYLLS
jgi:hypothetical protein